MDAARHHLALSPRSCSARIGPRPAAPIRATARAEGRFEHGPLGVGQVHAVEYDGEPTDVQAASVFMRQLLALMKERGTCLVPTFTTTLREQDDATVAARQRANMPRKRAMTIRAFKLGVKIVAGTDIQYDDKYRLQDEMTEFVLGSRQ